MILLADVARIRASGTFLVDSAVESGAPRAAARENATIRSLSKAEYHPDVNAESRSKPYPAPSSQFADCPEAQVRLLGAVAGR